MLDWHTAGEPEKLDAATTDEFALLIEAAYVVDDESSHSLQRWVDAGGRAGLSWTDVGKALGISRQAAQQRFSALDTTTPAVPSPDDEGVLVRSGITAFNEVDALREEGDAGREVIGATWLKLFFRQTDATGSPAGEFVASVTMPSDLLIDAHDVIVVDVPIDRPFMGMTEMRHVVLRVRTAGGLEGLGWAGAFGNQLVPSLVAATDALAGELTGHDAGDRQRAMGRVRRLVEPWGPGLTRYVEAMIDLALHDLAGKEAGVPVASLLGAGGVDSVPVYASQHLWRDYDLDDLATGAAALVDAGWRAMKFRIGANDRASDEAERARVVRDAVGDNIDVMVDVNQGWTVARTKEVAPLLEPYRLAWLEDPIDHRDIAGYQRLVAEVRLPITHGEYHFDTDPIGRIAHTRAADVVMLDAHHLGGIGRWLDAAATCASAHLPVATHLSPEIGVHLAAATPNCRTLEYMDWSVKLFREQLELDASGRMIVPDRPGLGVTLDDDLVEARRVS